MMIAIGILFCIIFVNCFGGIDGVGEEADNGNGKKDLLFGQMWRKAFEAKRHNGKKTGEKEETVRKEVKKEPKKEEMEEKEEVAEKIKKRVKEEPKEEGGNKLWKKVKTEPIDDQMKEEEEKWEKMIKKEPKIEENEWEGLVRKPQTTAEEEGDQQQEKNNCSTSDQNDSNQSTDHSKIKNAKEMGENIAEIYKWKKKKRTKNERIINDETKLEIIKEFDKMRKECKMEKEYKSKDRASIEEKIAKELGTRRVKIYQWKKELLNREKKPMESEEKWEIIKKFDKMRREYKNKNEIRAKIEQKIARELGTFRNKIYEWKKEIIPKKKLGREERKEIIEKFNKMRKEYKNRKEYKANDRVKIEREIAKKLGTHRDKIFRWKREFAKPKPLEKRTNEQKDQIIELFDQLIGEFANKFNRKAGEQIKDKIARKFGVTGRTIDRWKKKKIENKFI